MSALKFLFWSGEQARLRTPWRFALFYIALGLCVVAMARAIEQIAFGNAGAFVQAPLTNAVVALALVLVLATVGRWVDRRSMSQWGLGVGPEWVRDFLSGLVIATLSVGAVWFWLVQQGWLTARFAPQASYLGFGIGGALMLQTARYLAGSIMEEVLMRGYLLRTLAELTGRRLGRTTGLFIALVVTSSVFGLAHLANPEASAMSAGVLVVLGFVFGLPYVLTGRLGYSIGLHMGWNVTQNVVLGMPNSGQVAEASAYVTRVSGPEIWTGGAFGIEGGFAGLIAAGICILLGLVLIWTRQKGLRLVSDIAKPPRAAAG